MNDFLTYVVIFASAAVVLQSLGALDRVNWNTHHGVRCAILGVAVSGFYTLVDSLYRATVSQNALIGVLIAQSVFMAVDRRGRR